MAVKLAHVGLLCLCLANPKRNYTLTNTRHTRSFFSFSISTSPTPNTSVALISSIYSTRLLRRAELPADRYWRAPPDPLLSASSLAEFVVLDCEPADGFAGGGGGGGGGKKGAAGAAAAGGGNKALWEVVVSGGDGGFVVVLGAFLRRVAWWLFTKALWRSARVWMWLFWCIPLRVFLILFRGSKSVFSDEFKKDNTRHPVSHASEHPRTHARLPHAPVSFAWFASTTVSTNRLLHGCPQIDGHPRDCLSGIGTCRG